VTSLTFTTLLEKGITKFELIKANVINWYKQFPTTVWFGMLRPGVSKVFVVRTRHSMVGNGPGHAL